MYISSDHPYMQMLTELVDNSYDEAMGGYAKRIVVNVNYETYEIGVRDDGRGLPQGTDPNTGKMYAELIYSRLNAGGKFDADAYKVSAGLHGCGGAVVNFLSKKFTVSTWRGTKGINLVFEDGELVDKCEFRRKGKDSGTQVWYTPDRTLGIFAEQKLESHKKEIENRMRFLATAVPQVTLEFNGEVVKPWSTDEILGEFSKLTDDIVMNYENGDVHINMVLNWDGEYNRNMFDTYANLVHTYQGGDHSLGARYGINDWLGTPDATGLGCRMFLSVTYPGIEYESQAKTKAINKNMKNDLQRIVKEWLDANVTDEQKSVVEAEIRARRNKISNRNTKKKRAKNNRDAFNSALWSGGFADCSSNDRQNCTLFIVEGQSAGGSVRQCRNTETQAVFPIRGKIINASTHDRGALERNNEVQGLRRALDCGFMDDVNPDDCRYGKIVFLTDGDTDGSHIRTLLTSVFYWCWRPLLEAGMVYCANPPLFSATKKKQRKWTSDRDEMIKLKNSGWDIQRLKGLGEQDPSDLYESTLSDDATLTRLVYNEMSGDEIVAVTGFDPNARKQCLIKEGVLW